MKRKTLGHELQTPSLGLTIAGLAALATHANGVKDADLIAFVALGLAGGGVAMALGAEVERHGEEWGWRGLARSLRSPSRVFFVHLLAHLPQLVACSIIAMSWRKQGRKRCSP